MLLRPWELAHYAQKVYDEPAPHVKRQVATSSRSGEIVVHDLAMHLYYHPSSPGSVPVLAIRGTVPTSAENWARDLQQWPRWDGQLGLAPSGFARGARLLFDDLVNHDDNEVWAAVAKSPVIVGHSLGAAEAARLAAVFVTSGFSAPRQLGLFNGPYPGGRRLRRLLEGIPAAHYHHRGDWVSCLEPLFGLYVQPVPFTVVGDELPPLEAHAIGNFTKEDLYA